MCASTPTSPDISPSRHVPSLPDARATLAILKGRKTLEGERMRRTRAAAAASAVNLKQRCGACKTCMNMLAGQRRYECLTQRMKAAALAGHAGAQIAVCQEDALGARVRVWWDGDSTFYPGVVAHYDAVSTEHTVCYDDGEVGMHKLWWVGGAWGGVELRLGDTGGVLTTIAPHQPPPDDTQAARRADSAGQPRGGVADAGGDGQAAPPPSARDAHGPQATGTVSLPRGWSECLVWSW